jgi:hypothetical protein
VKTAPGSSVVDDLEGVTPSEEAGAPTPAAPVVRPRREMHLHRPHASDRWWFTALVAVIYLLVSVLANYNVWTHGVTHTVQAGGGDVDEQIWFLAQTPWALVHGGNPFFNNFLNAPTGINLMDNTTMPLLGLVGAPITFLLGPIATWNILLNLALASSAFTFYLMARRFVHWRPAAFVGGLLYGFSPFIASEGVGHLFLVVGTIPPLVILFLDRFFRTRSDPPWLTGLLVGGCFVAEFYISSEVFVSMVVLTVVAAAVGAVWWVFRRPRVEVARLAKMGGCVLAVIAIGSGVGAWLALTGPQHVHGPEQPAVVLAGLSSDPVGLVVPTLFEHFTFNHAGLGDSLVAQRDAQWNIVEGAPWENGSYVGVLLLAILLVGTIALWRRPLVRFVAVMAAAGMVLSMGSELHVDGHLTGVPLPFRLLQHLPLLNSSIASRYAALFWLFGALLLAIIIDAAYVRAVAHGRPGDRVRATLIAGVLACGALVLLVPAWPYPSGPANVPTWFTTGARSIPVGTTVAVYPLASPADASAMLWQAMADMTFKMPGGYAIFPTKQGTATFFSAPSLTGNVLMDCAGGGEPQLSPSAIRSDLRQWKASVVAVAISAPGSACATRLFDSALGQSRSSGGVRLWSTSPARGGR